MLADVAKTSASEFVDSNISGHLSNPRLSGFEGVGISDFSSHKPRINAVQSVSRECWLQFAYEQRNSLFWPEKSGRIEYGSQFGRIERVAVSDSSLIWTVKFDCDAECRGIPAIERIGLYSNVSGVFFVWIRNGEYNIKINEGAISCARGSIGVLQGAVLQEQTPLVTTPTNTNAFVHLATTRVHAAISWLASFLFFSVGF
jgi:hypothetical protein